MAQIARSLLLAVATATISLPAVADPTEKLDSWFRDGYAALYVETAWERADEFAQYLADEIEFRSDDGLMLLNVNSFVIDNLDEWRNEGWLGTDIKQLKTHKLNATTAVFDIVWLDRYADGSTEISCGWYVADKTDGTWLLSQYIATACPD